MAPWLLAVLLCTVGLVRLRAQSDVPGDPSGTSGDFDGLSTTAGGYDTYTGNVKRTITDVVVPGTAGTIPLQFTRIYNSRVNVVPTPIGVHFGDANWRHNYQWEGQITTNTGGNTVYQVGYPDGRVINFRLNRANQVSDTFARGPAGTSDRFEISPTRDPSHHYLHLADGSQVMFSVQPDTNGNNDLLRAERLIDPYGAATALIYGTYNGGGQTYSVLSQIVEPGGRSLNLTYGQQSANDEVYGYVAWQTITGVYWQDSQGTTHQDASYKYTIFGPSNPNAEQQTALYCALSSVVYSQPQQAYSQAYVTASYTYGAANNDPVAGTAPPLLLKADDPFYPGPMHEIYYTYSAAGGNYGVWGIVQAENNFSTYESVSSITQDQPNTPTTATETRGDYADSNKDPILRNFKYGQSTAANVTTYAQAFQVTTATDFQGNATETYYNAQGDTTHGWGYVAQVTDAAGLSTQYTTEPYTGKVVQVTLPGGRTRKTTWVGVDPTSNESQLSTNYPYFVTSTTDERQQTTTYLRYTNTGYVYQINYPDQSHEYFTYQHFSGHNGDYYKIRTYTNKLGAQFTFAYGQNDDGQGPADLLKSVTRAYTDGINGASHSETMSYTYWPDNRVKTVQDGRGITEQFTYDPRGQITNVLHASDPNQSQVIYGYDDDGNCTTVTDELTHVTTIGYDGYRRVTSVQVPVKAPPANSTTNISSRTRWFAYDRRDNSDNPIGTATSQTSSNWSVSWLPSNATIQRVFSPNNWLTDEYDGMYVDTSQSPERPYPGNAEVHKSATYNVLSQPLSTTDAQGFASTYTYDAYSRPSTATDPLGGANHTVTNNYYAVGSHCSGGAQLDCTGLLASFVAPGTDAGNDPTVTSTYTNYDAMSRLMAATDPYSHTFDSVFDLGGDLTSQTDGANTTGYTYDSLGRRSEITYPDHTTEQWTYDASGNVSTYMNRATAICTYQYTDGRNRCNGYSWSNGAALSVAYDYDAAGRLVEVSNNAADIKFGYDNSGLLTSETERPGNLSTGLTTKYTHDQDGNVDSITYPSGAEPCFAYDCQERCAGMYSGSTFLSDYTYEGDWLRGFWLYPGIYTQYDHQNNGRITDVWNYYGNDTGSSNSGNISLHTYGYAPDGQISWAAREAINPNSGLDTGRGDAYYYFPDGSLSYACRNVAVTGGWPGEYSATADSVVNPSNLVSSGGNAETYNSGYSYNAAGDRTYAAQLNQPPINYYDSSQNPGENEYAGSSYDSNGNTTNSAVGWTYAYDAENHLLSATGPNNETMGFSYDPLGRVIAQVANGVWTYFYYAGNQRIEERDSNNNLHYDYLFAAPGSDRILYRQDFTTSSIENFVWYLSDAMGNTTHLLANNGAVIEQYTYDAYGTPSVYNASGILQSGSQYDNRYLFKGAGAYEWLSQAALYYCRARFYLPEHGRWLQPDPIGQAGGLNIYTYCHNDPIGNTDSFGLDDTDFSSGGDDTSDPGITLVPADPGTLSPPVVIIPTTPGYSGGGNGKAGGSGKAGGNGHTPSDGSVASLVTPGVSIAHFPKVSGGWGIETALEGVDITLSGTSTYHDVGYLNDGPISADVAIDPIDLLTGFLASGSKAVLGSVVKSAAKRSVSTAVEDGLSLSVRASFRGGRYSPWIAASDTLLYRAENFAQGVGQFFGVDKPFNSLDAEIMFNIKKYGNNATELGFYRIPAGTRGFIGSVADGSGIQIFIPNPVGVQLIEHISLFTSELKFVSP